MNDVIYFSVNNWFCGRDYPPLKCFKKWLGDNLKHFRNDKWAKENKLCIYFGIIDMSENYTVSAPREWVEKNCPELLTDEEYTYITHTSKYTAGKGLFKRPKIVWEKVENKKKYSDFVYDPKDVEDGECDRVGNMPFREYREENFGSEYYETGYWDEEEDTEDIENEDEA